MPRTHVWWNSRAEYTLGTITREMVAQAREAAKIGHSWR